jgi:hypothetical protein
MGRFIFVFCVLEISAQNTKTTLRNTMSYQLELGINYSSFPKEKGQFEGTGFQMGWKPYTSGDAKGLPFLYYNEYWAYKLIYKDKHIVKISSVSSVFFNSDLKVSRQDMGVFYRQHKIASFGYGRPFRFRFATANLFAQLSYRKGHEDAIHFYYQDNILGSSLQYKNPWGLSALVEIERTLFKNFGIGLNGGYYYFPFENGRLHGGNIEYYNPTLQNDVRAPKHILIGTVKIFYQFHIPKSKNR